MSPIHLIYINLPKKNLVVQIYRYHIQEANQCASFVCPPIPTNHRRERCFAIPGSVFSSDTLYHFLYRLIDLLCHITAYFGRGQSQTSIYLDWIKIISGIFQETNLRGYVAQDYDKSINKLHTHFRGHWRKI